MKLSCALVACNENQHYLQFWPIVKKAWWDIVGIPCVMVYVGSVVPDHLKNDRAVIHFPPIEGWPTATQAQVIRLLYPALLQCDGAVLLSDMDMVPMQRDWFVNGLANFSPNQFVSLRGIDEGEKQIYMCYVAALPKVWSSIFQISNIQDVRNIMNQWASNHTADGQHGGKGWCTDQIILYNRVKTLPPENVGLVPWTQSISRLDRGNPYEWWHWNEALEKNIKEKRYVDFHMPPYSSFQNQIDAIVECSIISHKEDQAV